MATRLWATTVAAGHEHGEEAAPALAVEVGHLLEPAVDLAQGAVHVQRHRRAHRELVLTALLATLPDDVLPPRAPLPAGSRMPLASNPLFVGRGHELLQVATALMEGDATVALGQVVASTGLGGLGKTQLAVELVHRRGRYFAVGVFWLSFASPDEIPLQVAACSGPGAMELASGIENTSLEERVERVQRAWQSAVPRLLVFDNCEQEDLLDAWRPRSGGCRVLVTSQRTHWSPTLGVLAALGNLVDVKRDIASQAAQLRATRQIKLPDALILATAIHMAADQILTLDRRWRGVDSRVRLLEP
jgi:hypothetical protein